jgi:hypothetical protein
VRHPHPDVELCIDGGGNGALHVTPGVIEQDFGVANVDPDGRKPPQIGAQRGRE